MENAFFASCPDHPLERVQVMPRVEGHEERAEMYKLYHYLNHYNMFGSSYRSSCASIINRFM